MNHCSLNDEQRELLVPYLLGELSSDALQAIDMHLAQGCSRCEREMQEMREALALLAYSAPTDSPSKSVREKLLSRLSEESGESKVIPLQPAPVLSRFLRPNGSLTWFMRVAASLVVLMLFAETVYLLNVKNRVKQQEKEIANRKEQIAKLEDQNDKNKHLITSMGASRRLIVLDGQLINQLTKASGRAFWDTDKDSWLFYIEKLPPAPKGKIYQLWFISDAPLSGETFQTDANGRAVLRMSSPRRMGPIKAAAISLEPEGGSDEPKGAIYLLGPVGPVSAG